MKQNYSSSDAAVNARQNYWRNRDKILSSRAKRYATDSDFRATAIASAQRYRHENIDYVRQFDRIRGKIRYAKKMGWTAEVEKLLVEKRLLQMTKPNRKTPIR